MSNVNPKWYRVYNGTSEYFALAMSQLQALNAVCDHVEGGAEFDIEYATKSGVCSNTNEIVGEFDIEEILNELYYHEDVEDDILYILCYSCYDRVRKIGVFRDCVNAVHDYFDGINKRGDYTLEDIHICKGEDDLDDVNLFVFSV